MTVINLDREAQKCVLNGELDIAIPFSMRAKLPCGRDELKIDVFPMYEKNAHVFLERFGDDIFSKDAICFIRENFGNEIKRLGFSEDEEETLTPNDLFMINSPWDVRKDVIFSNTYRLSDIDISKYRNMTTYELQAYATLGVDAFVSVSDGCIVSIAALNPDDSTDFGDFDCRVSEIGCETCEAYRCRGYAASNIAALAMMTLQTKGGVVTYETHTDNIPAARAAEQAGFVRYGSSYYYLLVQ
ncbi:MAG: hypothetical protein LUH54_04025 [Firmicutes bacterium]|nr:hypothetical protein [Bacillota bacterium]